VSYKFTLEPYSSIKSRFRCPACNKDKCFTRYINSDTREHIAPHVGRCNREINCGYHYSPSKYFEENITYLNSEPTIIRNIQYHQPEIKSVSTIDFNHFRATLSNQPDNHFITYLNHHLGSNTTRDLVSQYFLATSDHWSGATVFWQIDGQNKIRTGKVMLYNPQDGRRVKEPFNHVTWMHKVLKLDNYNLKQCLFGEHLIKQSPNKPIAIVESEKTAVIASAYIPQFNWLATGGLNNLNEQTFISLRGKKVVLFPDLGAEDKWKERANKLRNIVPFKVSDLLSTVSSKEDQLKGYDLADYLIKCDLKDFLVS